MGVSRTKHSKKSGHPRITLFDRIRILAESCRARPKNEQERQEAETVIRLMDEQKKAA